MMLRMVSVLGSGQLQRLKGPTRRTRDERDAAWGRTGHGARKAEMRGALVTGRALVAKKRVVGRSNMVELECGVSGTRFESPCSLTITSTFTLASNNSLEATGLLARPTWQSIKAWREARASCCQLTQRLLVSTDEPALMDLARLEGGTGGIPVMLWAGGRSRLKCSTS